MIPGGNYYDNRFLWTTVATAAFAEIADKVGKKAQQKEFKNNGIWYDLVVIIPGFLGNREALIFFERNDVFFTL